MKGHSDLVRSLTSFDGQIISGSYDSRIIIWQLGLYWTRRTEKSEINDDIQVYSKGSTIQLDFPPGHSTKVYKIQASANRVLSCSQDQNVIVWDFGSELDCRFF